MKHAFFALFLLAAVCRAGTDDQTEEIGPRISPIPSVVQRIASPQLPLDGDWKFHPAPPPGFEKFDAAQTRDWRNIHVPGEWVMQGFDVKPGTAAAYWREFDIPADWNGMRIKLRCDGVYSDATVSVNGKPAGAHIGGFTPFELDVTNLAVRGQRNIIVLAVKNESLADSLASASQYACHPLGGITRKLRLIALPPVNLSTLHVNTTFGPDFRDATLAVELRAANESGVPPASLAANLALTSPDGKTVPLSPTHVPLDKLVARVSIPVAAPDKWDNEHPNLYTLTVTLNYEGKIAEQVKQKFGFRQVEVRGNQLFVNNVPIKLHGVCRHETHPLLGRSLTPALDRQDAAIFRDGNCNFIRTSHYPPAEEFIEACDELGMFVEVEAPFCWADRTHLTAAQVPGLVTRQELEMLEFYRNHPSVTHWSMGNESERAWKDYFLPAAKLFKHLDPSRPINYSSIRYGMEDGFCDIGNHHYPGPGGPEKYAASARPVVFDEFCHLNCYNRRELATDPGLRDLWGPGLAQMWEKMRKSRGCLGGSIWAGIDDTFFLPNGDTVGYGAWGPIDGWRRQKPEFWHMKKAYSPLRLGEEALPANQPVRLSVENRHDFTNLSEIRFVWKLDDLSGTAAASAAPGQTGTPRNTGCWQRQVARTARGQPARLCRRSMADRAGR